jgi:hypothetical protein
MTNRTLASLQWVGLLAGAGIWAVQHILGFGIAYVACSPGNAVAGVSHDLWEGTLMAAAALCVVGAEYAAVTVLLRTRDVSYQDDPPAGRIRFFAIAAAVSNVLFLMIILLDGFAGLFDTVCRQG